MADSTQSPAVPTSTSPDIAGEVASIETKFEQLEDSLGQRVRDVELEVAGRRSYEKVVVALGYAVVAIGFLLGFLGYQNMSDIEKDLDSRIDNRISALGQNKNITLASLEQLVEEATALKNQLETTKNRWETQIAPVLALIEGYDPDTDLKGRYLEIQHRRGEPGWRERATTIVSRIAEHIDKAKTTSAISSFDSGDIFNVAQLSRTLNRNDLEHKLINAAYEASKTPSTRALYLQLQARQAPAGSENRAFNQLMEMVSQLGHENPQIVVGEAWNAAEGLRQYTHLIEAIDKLIRRQAADPSAFLPSYAIWVKGRAHIRRGLPGDPQKAVDAFSAAVQRLRLEGLGTQWAGNVLSDFDDQLRSLLRSGVDTTNLVATVDASGLWDLKSKIAPLLRGMRGAQGAAPSDASYVPEDPSGNAPIT